MLTVILWHFMVISCLIEPVRILINCMLHEESGFVNLLAFMIKPSLKYILPIFDDVSIKAQLHKRYVKFLSNIVQVKIMWNLRLMEVNLMCQRLFMISYSNLHCV